MKQHRMLFQPEERRQQLLGAATWAFARRGYRHTGVSDIIARAGVARGTFYLYFESKHQIFLAIVSAFHDQVAEALEQIEDAGEAARAQGAKAVIAASFKRWLEFFAAHRDATAVVLREASSIDPRLRRLQSLGLVNPALSPEFVARLQLGMLDELINTFVLREAADLGAVAEQLAAFMWDGIRRADPRT